jgi:hypothetical protein
MSYLHEPRLVFTGDFYADTATVNNDVRHYNNELFEPVFQDPSTPTALYGWWNPNGGNQFNLQQCTVKQVTLPGGKQYTNPADDIIIGHIVGAPGDKGSGKMLDLDPQWQMSSELWCITIRIYSTTNELLLQGDMVPAGFRDLQLRQTDGGRQNGQPLGGTWTSVLTNLVWGANAGKSNFLNTLRQTTHNNTLSINLNMYGFYYSHNDGRYSNGRIIGSIGPWFQNEPLTFAPTRRLYGTMVQGTQNNPLAYFNYTNFLLDAVNASLTVDFGASFPIANSMGSIASNNAQYVLATSSKPLSNDPSFTPVVLNAGTDFTALGPVNYTAGNADWLNITGGIVRLDNLTQSQLSQLKNNQLLLLQVVNNQYQLLAREAVQGFTLRADNFVQRLDCGDSASVNFYAYQWGIPQQGVNVSVSIQPKTQALFGPVSTGDDTSKIPIPWINIPVEGLTFGNIANTDANGKTSLSITGNSINNPRQYVDGQVYYISYQNNPVIVDNAAYGMDAVYVHLRDDYAVPANPTWDDVSEVFIQFGNVYPLMSKFVVDLASEQAVTEKRDILIYAFTRKITDTFYMPVTRDLSEAKRQTIVKWLQNPLPGKEGIKMTSARAAAPEQPAEASYFESAEMKKVRALTQAKNGANALTSQQENQQ